MGKHIKIVLISTIFALNFFIYDNHNINIYALSEENKIDLLISNKQIQDNIESQIEELDKYIEQKSGQVEMLQVDEVDTENEIEVVSLSFVDGKDNVTNTTVSEDLLEANLIKDEILKVQSEKSNLEKQLEEYIIEGTKLEKTLEEEKKEYLLTNNLEYISGCWPVPSYTEISSPFGERIHPITNKISFHKGIDIPAPQYTDIVSSDDGIIIYSGTQNGYGNVVKIKHFDGKITVYAHNTENIVSEGDIVKQGQTIAKVGTTGDSTGNHVHFETIINDENINPIDVVNR